ncbi:MAG: hypothetical protein R2695_09045 [Acidimicrobiales bacterium]
MSGSPTAGGGPGERRIERRADVDQRQVAAVAEDAPHLTGHGDPSVVDPYQLGVAHDVGGGEDQPIGDHDTRARRAGVTGGHRDLDDREPSRRRGDGLAAARLHGCVADVGERTGLDEARDLGAARRRRREQEAAERYPDQQRRGGERRGRP